MGFSGAIHTCTHENPCPQPWAHVSTCMGYGFHKTHGIFYLYMSYDTIIHIIYRNLTYGNIKNRTKRRNAHTKQLYMHFSAGKGQDYQN
jgi:hypothetical protein